MTERGEGDRTLPGVMVVLGTRPEAVKLAPVIEALRKRSEAVRLRVVHTGQHGTLADPFLDLFDIRPDHALGLMREGQGVDEVLARGIPAFREVVLDESPRMVLVQGDTTTVFLASLTAFLERIAVGHVEAGLRSRDKWSPFPEEIFRRLTGVVADHHFAATPGARDNLVAEGVPQDRIHLTGNPVVDALLRAVGRAGAVRNRDVAEVLEKGERVVLLTAHRRESFGAPLERILGAVGRLADEEEVRIVYPVHPNPEVREPAHRILGGHPGVLLVEPLDYLDLTTVLARSELVMTDSGGIQEEAPTFGVPLLVLREVTERPEGIRAGLARLVGSDPEAIVREARSILSPGARGGGRSPGDRARGLLAEGDCRPNPYGDGRAGERIAGWVLHLLAGEEEPADWQPPDLDRNRGGIPPGRASAK